MPVYVPAGRVLLRPLRRGGAALAETAELRPGDRVLDLGCGCGVAGVFAAQRVGPEGHVVFVDSNVRAAALAEQNARANGVASFRVVASATAAGLEERSFDAVLANPPYYADHGVARLFVERAACCSSRAAASSW